MDHPFRKTKLEKLIDILEIAFLLICLPFVFVFHAITKPKTMLKLIWVDILRQKSYLTIDLYLIYGEVEHFGWHIKDIDSIASAWTVFSYNNYSFDKHMEYIELRRGDLYWEYHLTNPTKRCRKRLRKQKTNKEQERIAIFILKDFPKNLKTVIYNLHNVFIGTGRTKTRLDCYKDMIDHVYYDFHHHGGYEEDEITVLERKPDFPLINFDSTVEEYFYF